jgi:hypothetical protein
MFYLRTNLCQRNLSGIVGKLVSKLKQSMLSSSMENLCGLVCYNIEII